MSSMSNEPKGADVVVEVETPTGPAAAIAIGLFVEPSEQRRIDQLRDAYASKLLGQAHRTS